MIYINCDIGERGINHPVDNELMEIIDIANIACGGHSGDKDSVKYYLNLCKKNSVKPTAHLSYPDIENFGRRSINIKYNELKISLDNQYKLMAGVKTIKFHGALYNDACIDINLAEFLKKWLLDNKIDTILTPFDSILATKCRAKGIKILAEAFAERRYCYNTEKSMLSLVSRSKSYSSINNTFDAINQSKEIIFNREVECLKEVDKDLQRTKHPIEVDTICIHSDSEIALDLARELKELGV